jgi:hypothetical protein
LSGRRTNRGVRHLRRFCQEQDRLRGDVLRLQAELDAAKVLLGKQVTLEERIQGLEGQVARLVVEVKSPPPPPRPASALASALKKTVTIQEPEASPSRRELAKSQSLPVYAVATESL